MWLCLCSPPEEWSSGGFLCERKKSELGIVKIRGGYNARCTTGDTDMTTEQHLSGFGKTTNPTVHLARVKDLLAELDKMKTKGVGARERLEYILDGGISLIDKFDFQDAFDIEHRAMTKRLKLFGDMSSTLLQHQTQWAAAPVEEEVKEAAGQLLEHVEGFIKTAQKKERDAEIDMLSQLWEWGPDMSHMYYWLTSGRPKPIKTTPPAEIKELEEKKAELYEEVREEVEVHPNHHDQVADEFVEANPGASLDEFQEKLEETPLELDEVIDELATPNVKEVEEHFEVAIEEAEQPSGKEFPVVSDRPEKLEKVVSKVNTPIVKELPKVQHIEQDDDSQLRNAAWTDALREMTAREWHFIKEMQGHIGYSGKKGTVLLWHANECEARLELLEEPGNTEVTLRILIRGRLRRTKTQLSQDELVRMHLDPLPFVKRTLES